jgi:hypothetical protein
MVFGIAAACLASCMADSDAEGPIAAGAAGSSDTGGAAGSGKEPTPWADCGPSHGFPPLLHTSLDSLEAIFNPDVGNGAEASTHEDPTFVPGRCANAIVIGSTNHFVRYPAEKNIHTGDGAVDFWIMPAFEPLDGVVRNLVSASNGARQWLLIRKGGDDVDNALEVILVDGMGVHPTRTKPPHVTMNQWTRMTVEWRFDNIAANVRIWLDKKEVSYAERASGPKNRLDADGWLFIGASSESDENAAHALLDDFTVHGYSLTPR